MKSKTASFALALLTGILFVPERAYGIPAFARQYQTSCMTCHVDFPKLNDFGKAFKDAGFKFPADDENNLKIPPVLLGADAQKDAFPNVVWPGEIPGQVPIGLRMNNFLQVTSSNRNRFNALAEPGQAPPILPGSDFESGLFSIFTAGSFGNGIAFWVDDDISVAGDNAAGALGDAYLKFVNVSRLIKLPKDSLSFRVGQFELDLPFTQARSINLSPYDIYQQANVGALSPAGRQQNVSNQFTFADAARGAEVSGGHQYGGYHYSFAVFDQSSNGVAQSANISPFVPSATASSSGGVGFGSDTGFKNIYGRFSYRFNLERDKASRHAIQAATATGPRDHTYLSLGTFFVRGNPQQVLGGVDGPIYAREAFYRVGGDFSFNFRKLNLYGVYLYAHDDNMLPVDSAGAPIPLPLETGSPLAAGFRPGIAARFNGGFIQADYSILPWIMAIGRWDGVNSTADRINGLGLSQDTSFFAPYSTSRNRYTPGAQFLIRANIKASVEYQIRPRQSITSITSAAGITRATDPFRVNTLVFATEFVY